METNQVNEPQKRTLAVQKGEVGLICAGNSRQPGLGPLRGSQRRVGPVAKRLDGFFRGLRLADSQALRLADSQAFRQLSPLRR